MASNSVAPPPPHFTFLELLDIQPKLEGVVKIRFYFVQKRDKFLMFLNDDNNIISFVGSHSIERPNVSPLSHKMRIL